MSSAHSINGQRTESLPRVTIVIPSYEEERFILRLLDQFPSALRCRLGIEIVVSDGGSTDGTVALAKTRADRVVEWNGPTPQNISIGRNRGADHAQGDVLIFLNADVHLDDAQRFITQMVSAVEDEHIAAATCNVLVNREEETLADKLFHRCFNSYCRMLNAVGMGMGRGECHVVRKSMFLRVGGYSESIPAGEDYEFFLRLRRLGAIRFVSSQTVYESPRRYRSYGYLRISLLWFVNALSVLIFHRSLSKQWTPVR